MSALTSGVASLLCKGLTCCSLADIELKNVWQPGHTVIVFAGEHPSEYFAFINSEVDIIDGVLPIEGFG
jgi:hypothetical protein